MNANLLHSGVSERDLVELHKLFDFNALLRLVREQLPPIDERLWLTSRAHIEKRELPR